MTSAVTVPDQRDKMGECPVAGPVAPDRPSGQTSEFCPDVPMLQSVPTTRPGELGAWLPPDFVATGVRGRLVQLLRLLDNDAAIDVVVASDGTVEIPAGVLRLRHLAARCGVSSASTAGEWLKKWRQAGYLHQSGRPVVDVAALTSDASDPSARHTQSPSEPSATDQSQTSSRVTLDVLLTHLAQAHREERASLIARLDEWAALIVESHIEAAVLRGPVRGSRAVFAVPEPRGSARGTERSEVVSYSTSKEKLATSLTDTNTARGAEPRKRAAQTEQPAARRNRDELFALVDPLLDSIRRLGLAPMTNWKGVEQALRPYTDHQVAHAQRLIRRQLNSTASTPISSPIGLLVREARAETTEYFDAPPPVTILIDEHETTPTDQTAATPTDFIAQIALARQQLAASNEQ